MIDHDEGDEKEREESGGSEEDEETQLTSELHLF